MSSWTDKRDEEQPRLKVRLWQYEDDRPDYMSIQLGAEKDEFCLYLSPGQAKLLSKRLAAAIKNPQKCKA